MYFWSRSVFIDSRWRITRNFSRRSRAPSISDTLPVWFKFVSPLVQMFQIKCANPGPQGMNFRTRKTGREALINECLHFHLQSWVLPGFHSVWILSDNSKLRTESSWTFSRNGTNKFQSRILESDVPCRTLACAWWQTFGLSMFSKFRRQL